MGWFSRNKKTNITGFAEQDNTGAWMQYFNQYMQSINGELQTYAKSNPYALACNIAEVFIPIDAIADRVAGVSYKLRNKRTLEPYEAKGNLLKLLTNPNPQSTIADLVYKDVFSKLSDGNSYIYTKTPESIKNPTIDNISNIWVLEPNKTTPKLLKNISNPFLMKSKADFIEYYKTFFFYEHKIEPRYIYHSTSMGLNEFGIGTSPLKRVEKNIDNILAVYQARYNVYAKNGNGGILSKAPQTGGNSLQEAVDPATREEILKDLQNRNGITGNKNFIGISSIPLTFIKTLGTIAELQPFEETESNAITIAGIYGVDPELIPRKGSSTFTNKNDAEKGLWQNVLKSLCQDEADILSKVYYLPEGIEFYADLSEVEVLQEDKKTGYESDSVLIGNLKQLQELGQDVNRALTNITEDYNGN